MLEIIFVTTNKGKVETAKQKIDKSINLKHIDFEINEPNINDINVIAEHKVKTAFSKLGKPCISLDAGFYIPNYPNNPNFPGAFPKRELINKIGIDGLLENMQGVKDRTCYFKECLAYYDGINLKMFYGYVYGTLTTKKRGIDSSKKWSDLWYVFIPKNCTKTLAEMTDEERKNRKDDSVNPFIEFNSWFKNYSKS